MPLKRRASQVKSREKTPALREEGTTGEDIPGKQPDGSIYVPIEELSQMRQDMVQEVSRLEKSKGDPMLPKAIVILVDAFEHLLKDVLGMDTKVSGVQNDVQERAIEHQAVVEYMRDAVIHQSDAIFRLVQQAEILEAHALVFRCSTFAVMLRRHLDDVRFIVADAFMMLFPENFPENDILNVYDKKKKTVAWNNFTSKLNKHYRSYHKALWSDTSYRWVWTQLRSVFDGFRHDDDKELADITAQPIPRDTTVIEVVPNYELVAKFPKKHIMFTDQKGYLSVGPYDNYLRLMLNFFVPLFIWRYNEAKKKLALADATIQRCKSTIERQDALIDSLKRTGSFSGHVPPASSRMDITALFDIGTSLGMRLQNAWRSFVLRTRKEETKTSTSTSNEEKKRKAEDEHDASGRSKARGAEYSGVVRRRFSDDILKLFEQDFDPAGRNPPGTYVTPEPSLPVTPSPTTSSFPSDDGITSVAMGAAISAKKRERYNLGRAAMIRAGRLAEFNRLRKCLAVLIDDNLLKVALLGNSLLKEATNKFAHQDLQKSAKVLDAVAHAKDVIDNSDIPDRENPVDYNKEMQKIIDLVHDDGKYLEKPEQPTEQETDKYVWQKIGASDIKPDESITDMHILMQWLDTLKPVPKDTEGQMAQDHPMEGQSAGRQPAGGHH